MVSAGARDEQPEHLSYTPPKINNMRLRRCIS